MPPLPAAPDTIKIKFLWVPESAKQFGSKLFVKYSGGPPSTADLATYAGIIGVGYNTNLVGLVSVNVTLNEIECTDIASATGNVGAAAVGIVGTDANPTVSDDTAAVATFAIPRRYRGGQPKGYWPIGTTNDKSDGSTWKSGSLTAWATAFDNFLAAVAPQTYSSFSTVSLVNVSYYHGFTAVLNPITGRYRNVPTLRGTPTIDNAAFVAFDARMGSQRRRRVR